MTRVVDLEDVQVVQDDPSKDAIAIADGTTETFVDQYTGATRDRDKWYWLPRRHCQVNDDGSVTVEEWLALKEGLI